MGKKLVWWIVGLVGVLFLGAALWGPIVSNVEHPKYKVAERSGNIEIRDYAPMIVAELRFLQPTVDALLPAPQRGSGRDS